MSDLINPLESILSQAAQLPHSGALKAINKRLNANSNLSLILLDTSLSMAQHLKSGERKIDILRNATSRPIQENERAIAFSSDAQIITGFANIPEPNGGTNMECAIALAATYRPKATLIISDGVPDCETKALSAAQKLTGVINCLFIGNQKDTQAIAFMRKLARLGCGKATVCDISITKNVPNLKSAITLLLPSSL